MYYAIWRLDKGEIEPVMTNVSRRLKKYRDSLPGSVYLMIIKTWTSVSQ